METMPKQAGEIRLFAEIFSAMGEQNEKWRRQQILRLLTESPVAFFEQIHV